MWNHLKAQSPPCPPSPLEQHLLNPIRTAVSDPAAPPLGLKQPVGRPQDSLYSEHFSFRQIGACRLVGLRHP